MEYIIDTFFHTILGKSILLKNKTGVVYMKSGFQVANAYIFNSIILSAHKYTLKINLFNL